MCKVTEDGEVYIGSADMMQRNLDRRVEVLLRIDSPDLKQRLKNTLDLMLSPDVDAWELDGTGHWSRVDHGDGELLDAQTQLMQRIAGHA